MLFAVVLLSRLRASIPTVFRTLEIAGELKRSEVECET